MQAVALIVVGEDAIEIRLTVVEEVLALHGTLRVPLAHIRSVSTEPVPPALWRGVKLGTNLPGLMVAATFVTEEGVVFYDIRHGERCVTLELADDRYKRIVIELDAAHDPADVASAITAAKAAEQRRTAGGTQPAGRT